PGRRNRDVRGPGGRAAVRRFARDGVGDRSAVRGRARLLAALDDLRGREAVTRPAELIERKRDGGELSPAELKELMLGYARDEVPDYQLAAFCMAVFFRGLSGDETYALTQAMIGTGETIDLRSALGRKVVDKHSTGGVGDKTSIAVGPIIAACG